MTSLQSSKSSRRIKPNRYFKIDPLFAAAAAAVVLDNKTR